MYDYEQEIIEKLRYEHSMKKTTLANMIRGRRNNIFKTIDELEKNEILEIDENNMVSIKQNDIIQDHERFQTMIEIFDETVSNAIPQLKKIVKKTNKPLFWFTMEKIRPDSEEAMMHHINKKARDEVLTFLMPTISNLVSTTFILYQRILLGQVSKSQKKLLNDDIKTSIYAIKDVKEKLSNITGDKNKHVLESYWFQMTAGLRF